MSTVVEASIRRGQVTLSVPPLERGKRGYHHDLIASVAKHFGRENVDVKALEQVLTPLTSGSVLAAAHAIAGRSVLELTTGIISSASEQTLWRDHLKQQRASHSLIQEIESRQNALFNFGREVRVQFFDRTISAQEMQELLRQQRLGLVSLDWIKITSDQAFFEKTQLRTPSHAFPDIPVKHRPLFYPVVPLVGYRDNGATMLVHTHLHPFIEIPTDLFEQARKSARAEKTVVFFDSSPSQDYAPKSEYSWNLPGAFTGSVLIRPEEIPTAPKQSSAEVARTMKLAIALGKPACESYHSIFPYFLKAASLVLAKNDSSGDDIKALEEHIIAAAAKAQENKTRYSNFGLRDTFESGLKGGTTKQETLIKRIGSAEKYLNEELAQDASSASSESTSVIPHGVFVGSRQEILDYFKSVVDRAFLPWDRDLSNQISAEIIAVTKECIQSVKSYELGSEYVERLSPTQRQLALLHRFIAVDSALQKEKEKMQKLEYQYAFSPKVLLAAAPHGEEIKEQGQTMSSDADEKALEHHDILSLRKYGLYVGRYWYDAPLGSLICATGESISELIHHGLSIATDNPKPGDNWGMEKLMTVLSQFPLTETQCDAIVTKLQSDTDGFEQYIADSKNWLGKQSLRNKSWLENKGGPHYNEAIQYLGKMYKALKEGTTPETRVPYYANSAPLTMSSMLGNSQAEELLRRFIRTSLEEGIPLAQVVYGADLTAQEERNPLMVEEFGKKKKATPAQYLETLMRHERLHNALDYLSMGDDGSLRLTELGVTYLLDLIDPSYPYHHTFDDSRSVRQTQHEERRNFR